MARPGFMAHPKFRRLVQLLGIPDAHARGLVECLWETAYENGDPVIGDATDIELAARWTGTPGVLTEALLACGGASRVGLIEPIEDLAQCFQIHDLYDHAPDYVRKRAEREAKRRATGKTLHDIRSAAAQARWKAKNEAPNANGMQTDANDRHLNANGCKRHANGEAPAPAPAPAPALFSTEPAVAAAVPDDASPVFITFTTVGKGEHQWPLRESYLDSLSEAYPGIDVRSEARKARLWLEANPTKRKTARGMPKFLQGWMERKQNAGPRPHNGTPLRRAPFAPAHFQEDR